MTIDLLPTFAKLAGAELPPDRSIDGQDIWPLLPGQPGAKTPHEAFYFYWGGDCKPCAAGVGSCTFRTTIGRWPGLREAAAGRHPTRKADRALAVRPASRPR